MPWIGDPSKRSLLFDNVVTTLQGITVANGYELTVQEVETEARDIDTRIISKIPASGTPLHMLLSGPEETVSAASGGLVSATWTVRDWMVVNFADLERAIVDVKRAIWADRRRGTHPTTGARLANDTRIPVIVPHDGIFYPHELVLFEFEIDYVHLEGAP
jgi:hypothetical protein